MASALFTLAQALYLFAPLLVSALLSAVVHRYDFWTPLAVPIDGGLSFHGQRLFGDGKTWRGWAIATLGSIVAVSLQKHVIGAAAGSLAVVDYARASALLLGGAIGSGAILGELPNSFMKRRLGIARGATAERQPWRLLFWIWDQVDLLTGTWPLLELWVRPTMRLVAASVALALVLHPAAAAIGWLLGARAHPR
jgi:CDP-2,3-bis-(O-geranylgeranyl)-sn-glycerol synthase